MRSTTEVILPSKRRKLAERDAAREELRKLLPPGSVVHTVIRHVARSGMSRNIDCYLFQPDKDAPGGVRKLWLSPRIAKACGLTFDTRKESIKIGGAGMDMGFAIVQDLSYALHGLPGKDAPALPEGERHGYTLRHEWI